MAFNKKKVKVEPKEVVVEKKENQFMSILESEIGEEYEELKAEYKEAKRQCTSIAKRRMVMQEYADRVTDLAIEARLSGEWELNRELNQLIDSLQRRTFSGKKGW